MPEQAVHLLNAGQVLEDELLLIGLESTQIIFDASFLRKGPLPGVSRLGLWHGVQARLRLLNPVASGTWMTATLREAPRLVAQKRSVAFRYTAEADDVGNLHSLSAVKKSGTSGRHFAVSIEGLDHYRARIFRPLSSKEYVLYDPAASMRGSEAREMGCAQQAAHGAQRLGLCDAQSEGGWHRCTVQTFSFEGVHFADLRKRKHGTLASLVGHFGR